MWLVIMYIDFGEKYGQYKKWLRSDINMEVPRFVKSDGLNKKSNKLFVFGSIICDKIKMVGGKGCWKGKENLASSSEKVRNVGVVTSRDYECCEN